MLKFYFHPTPNPMKVALFLAESGLEYEVIAVDTRKGEQHSPDFRQINPNAKVPAIDDNGTIVFDSNAILLYLAEKTGQFLVKEEDRGQLLSWLMFIASGLGPYSGQAVHFQHAAPEKSPYAINRYRREAQRHYQILDDRLADREFIVGGTYSIVDIAAWGWIDKVIPVLGEGELEHYPNLKRWFQTVDARPAVAKARNVGSDISFKSDVDEETKRALFPQNYPS
ncbi:MAG: glutathione S-transferase N-terminal domain-containing protein [Oceanospirillaceae bacterium]|nr:glutathione S-transferase N-terminal domain-containing protein [Oceanospirillaceae bacterium]